MLSSEVPEKLALRLRSHGQQHLLRGLPELTASQRQSFLAQLEAVDFEQLRHILNEAEDPEASRKLAERAQPLSAVRIAGAQGTNKTHREAAAAGDEVLRTGKVAAILVAGGQGTRLGFADPKGMYPIGPVTGRTLFQILAEKIVATERRYGCRIPYFIMTSEATHDATCGFFEQHKFFGIDPADVTFFQQGSMPAVDARTGRLLLAEKGRLSTSPNGHGGALEALVRSGWLERLRERGIDWVFYHQVDNPLVPVCDAEFIGHSVVNDADVSVKVVAKLWPDEPTGNVICADGRLHIIEYTEFEHFPGELKTKWQPDGSPQFWAGSMAVHVFARSFLEEVTAGGADLPYHKALKKVPYLNDEGVLVEPDEPNAFKFERFIFDLLPLGRRWVVVEADRAKEFDPLKNEEGENSPASVRASLSRLYAGWLTDAGIAVPATNGPAIEISPLYALDARELARKTQKGLRVTLPLVLS